MIGLLIISTAPVWAILTFFYVKDRYDKEPRSLLVKLFVYGALVTFVAAIVGVYSMGVLRNLLPGGGLLNLLIENFLLIGLVEEYLKYIIVMRQTFNHPAFNEPYDGMIYAITVSLGFAALENILYVAQGGLQVAAMRAILSVPAHALFAAAMGYYIGKAKFSRTPEKMRRYLFRALLYPTLLHGTYNFLLSTGHSLLVMGVVPLSIGMWIMALRQVRLAELRSPFRP